MKAESQESNKENDDRPKLHLVTVITFILAMSIAGSLYFSGATQSRMLMFIIPMSLVLIGRTILTELGVRRRGRGGECYRRPFED